jgi:hypothetical protein
LYWFIYLEGHAVYLIPPEVVTIIPVARWLFKVHFLLGALQAVSGPTTGTAVARPPCASLCNAFKLSDFFCVQTAGAD